MSSPEILSPVSISRVGNANSPDSNASLVELSTSSPRNSVKLKSTQVQSMLRTNPYKYTIIENTGKRKSDCWSSFGFPAIIKKNSDPQRIDGFVSCKKCFTTYSFMSNSTRMLNQHNCESSKERNIILEANGTSPTQGRLTSFFRTKQASLKESEIMKIKDLQVEWICRNIRPFSIVEDNGLRRLIQECDRYGNINVDQVLRGADVTAAHSSKLAEDHRARISEELLEPLENDAVTFCPDMWSDPVHQVSYLGITATFVNDQFEFRSYDLCCSPFEEEDKTAESILAFNKEHDLVSIKSDNENCDDEYDFESEESDGIRFFRLRLLELLESMFVLEPIHFAAAFLHPRYRYLRKCSNTQINACKSYVRRHFKEISERENLKRVALARQSEQISEQNDSAEPPLKKKKRFGEEYESGDLSDEYGETEDEVDKYLSMRIDPELIVDNPLVFWKFHQKNLPLLSKLARMIHCIPATTATVEREFSGGGLVMSERRSSINPQNLNNILFLRSATR
ncbi:unnamed protein product [Rotaria sp. Silwood2]|nr:unnamed protein product [Rotaria sp. Silwood2]CAF4079962.1 unnamed protein product [Rotaria sp. Silwood2]